MLETKDYKGAKSCINSALTLCIRTGFKLYEPEAELILAKAYLAQGDKTQAKSFTNSALSKAQKMSYKLAENDAENLLKKIQ